MAMLPAPQANLPVTTKAYKNAASQKAGGGSTWEARQSHLDAMTELPLPAALVRRGIGCPVIVSATVR